MRQLSLRKLIETVLDVCQGTLDGLENVQEKMTIVMKVLAFVMLKEDVEIAETTGGRDLGLKLLADEVVGRLHPESVD